MTTTNQQTNAARVAGQSLTAMRAQAAKLGCTIAWHNGGWDYFALAADGVSHYVGNEAGQYSTAEDAFTACLEEVDAEEVDAD